MPNKLDAKLEEERPIELKKQRPFYRLCVMASFRITGPIFKWSYKIPNSDMIVKKLMWEVFALPNSNE